MQHSTAASQTADHLFARRVPDDRRPQRLPLVHHFAETATVRLASRAAHQSTEADQLVLSPSTRVTEDFSNLKMVGHVYIVEDAKDLAQIVRDATRYGGTFRPEE